MRYIKEFANATALQAAVDNGELGRPYLCYLQDQGKIAWDSEQPGPTPHDYSKDYLTFRILSDGNIIWKNTASFQSGKIIFYSKDGGSTWNQITSSTADTAFNVTAGETIQFKGNNNSYNGYTKFAATCQFELQGNIMSLIYGDDFIGKSVFPNRTSSNVDKLFNDCTGLTSAENLILPATTLTDYCYREMFQGCSSLITAPVLPAYTLVERCYQNMFRGCTSLTTAPELPATTVSTSCYQSMFSNCRSLTTVPSILPATTLAKQCYQGMFYGCTGLTSAPVLPATTLTGNCYYQMFKGCTSLITAPELPASILEQGCYNSMFNGCSSLSYIKCLAESGINQNGSTTSWVTGVASTGTFVKASGVEWSTGTSGIPSGWTVIEE